MSNEDHQVINLVEQNYHERVAADEAKRKCLQARAREAADRRAVECRKLSHIASTGCYIVAGACAATVGRFDGAAAALVAALAAFILGWAFCCDEYSREG